MSTPVHTGRDEARRRTAGLPKVTGKRKAEESVPPSPPTGPALATVSMGAERAGSAARGKRARRPSAEEARALAQGQRQEETREADVGDDEDAMQQEATQATYSLLPGLPPHVARAVNQQMRYIAEGLVAYINKYHPRLRSQATANVPTEADAVFRTLYEWYTSLTEDEAAIVAHRLSAAYDENRSVVSRTFPTDLAPPSGPAAQRKDKVTGASTKRGLEEAAGKAGLRQIATTFEGKWKKRLRGESRSFKWNTRVLELLVALSTTLFAKISQTFTTQEVEAMVVNGRILVSANEASAVAALMGADLNAVFADEAALTGALNGSISHENVAALADLIAVLRADSGERLDDQQQRGAQALAQMRLDTAILDNKQEAQDLRELLTTVRRMLTEDLTVHAGGSAEGAGKLITDPEYAGRIIIVDAGKRAAAPRSKQRSAATSSSAGDDVCTHAEQNLMLALAYSKYQGGAQVAGRKRPCVCCFVTLRLVDAHGYQVKYNRHAGGFWSGTTYLGLQRVATELGIRSAATLNEWVKGILTASEFKQYVTVVNGPADGVHRVAAKKVIGAKAKASMEFTTSEQSASIRPQYQFKADGTDDEAGAVGSKEESDSMDEGYE
ncbi:hypothetical protein [Streptomyces sp. NPDC048277]|uniref:hypothetical protein n=1 Tax=Streptomyces sp. NPDC048277 TaxID=3155027 RepID=UPI0033CED9FF